MTYRTAGALRLGAIGLCVMTTMTGADAAVIHVDASAPPGGDGASWATAYHELRDALPAAGPGDEVWIAAGTYRPAPPGGYRGWTFSVIGQTALYGGFDGTETSRDERDPVRNVTVLSGDLDQNDDGGETYDDNARHVVTFAGADDADAAVIDGVTIEGGYANPNFGTGGGIRMTGGSLTLLNCRLLENHAQRGGGLDVAEGGTIEIGGCEFRGNTGSENGAGLSVQHADTLHVYDSRIVDNVSEIMTGVRVVDVGVTTLTDVEIVGNFSTSGGVPGGWFESTVLSAEEVRVEDNTLTGFNGAGAIVIWYSTADLRECSFMRNGPAFAGGAIGASESDVNVVNSVFSRNRALHGSLLIASPATFVFDSCSIHAEGDGVIELGSGGSVTFRNSILWGVEGDLVYGPSSGLHASSSIIQGGWPGEGNLDVDPQFVQAGADDLRLADSSPALDAGDNALLPPGVTEDFAGNPRIQNGTVDMGAFEGPAGTAAPAAAFAGDLDPDEIILLTLHGSLFDPLSRSAALVRNVGTQFDACYLVEERDEVVAPEAFGYIQLGRSWTHETSIENGDVFDQTFVPFTADDLGGADPGEVDLILFDEAANSWRLAVSANTVPSPGGSLPIGDRFATEGPSWVLSSDLGDYGVHWDPNEQAGFAWATLDISGRFAFGVPRCRADCVQPPDGRVDFTDLMQVLSAWGTGAGPFDVDRSGTVDIGDVAAVLSSWGVCAP